MENSKSILEKHVNFAKVRDRQAAFTIDMKHQLLAGTDLPSLYLRGFNDCDDYVTSGFSTLPKRIKLRTDGVELECEDEALQLLSEEAAQAEAIAAVEDALVGEATDTTETND